MHFEQHRLPSLSQVSQSGKYLLTNTYEQRYAEELDNHMHIELCHGTLDPLGHFVEKRMTDVPYGVQN